MVGIVCNDISVVYSARTGSSFIAVKGFNLSVQDGEFVTIFGPNGCGKSTLLNALLGYAELATGTVEFSTENPRLGYVFQDYRSALMPWLNAHDNICFPLTIGNTRQADIHRKFKSIIEGLPISIDWQAYPYQLSGGQAQLVSILRTLIVEPDALLLDEPFSALDYQTNLHMLKWLQQISLVRKITMIFVSHQIDEAIFLGDKVVLLTQAPARVAEEIEIGLPRPRLLSVMGGETFRAKKEHILSQFLRILNENGSL